MKPKNKNQSGFLIVEIIVSLFIVGVIFVLYNGAVNSVFLTSNANHQEIALRIANAEMENLRSMGYTLVPSSGTFTSTLLASLPSGQANLTVSDYNSKTKLVTATVSWYESSVAATHNVSLTTLITQVGGLK